MDSISRSRRSSALLLIAGSCAAALTPIASAQVDVVWRNTYTQAGYVSSRSTHVAVHPDGGVVAVYTSNIVNTSGAPTLVELRHLTEDGDRVWRTQILIPWTSEREHPRSIIVDQATGAVALLLAGTTAVRILHFTPAGERDWTSTLSSVVPSTSLHPRDMTFSAAGDVMIAADQFSNYRREAMASVAAFDGSTGAQLWRTDLPCRYGVVADLDANGGIMLYRDAAMAWTATRVDSVGNIVSSTTIAATSLRFGRLALLRPQGGSFIGIHGNITRLDAAGVIQWSTTITNYIGSAVVTSNGDLIFHDAYNMYRLDGVTGAVVWTHAAPPEMNEYEYLTLLPDDAVCTTGRGTNQHFELGGVEIIDANGNQRALRTITDASLQRGRLGPLVADQLGNVFVSATYANAVYTDLVGRTLKLVEGGDPSSVFCAPAVPNSTGAPAELRAAGSPEIATNNLTLVLDALPSHTTVFALTSLAQGNVPGAGGSQGTLCLGGAVGRYVGMGQIRTTSSLGRASLQLDLTEMPTPSGLRPAVAGETWYIQAWYRDTNPGATSNFTNGISVVFQ